MNEAMYEVLEEKLTWHGYQYVGHNLLGEVVDWIIHHEVFRDYKITIDNQDKIQVRVTVEKQY